MTKWSKKIIHRMTILINCAWEISVHIHTISSSSLVLVIQCPVTDILLQGRWEDSESGITWVSGSSRRQLFSGTRRLRIGRRRTVTSSPLHDLIMWRHYVTSSRYVILWLHLVTWSRDFSLLWTTNLSSSRVKNLSSFHASEMKYIAKTCACFNVGIYRMFSQRLWMI